MPFAMSLIFEPTEFGNGAHVDPFFIHLIAIVQVPCAIRLPWYVMPTTPHTSPKAHGVQLARLRRSTFIIGFKIDYKHVTLCTFQNVTWITML
jgi:hypothetical protein